MFHYFLPKVDNYIADLFCICRPFLRIQKKESWEYFQQIKENYSLKQILRFNLLMNPHFLLYLLLCLVKCNLDWRPRSNILTVIWNAFKWLSKILMIFPLTLISNNKPESEFSPRTRVKSTNFDFNTVK